MHRVWSNGQTAEGRESIPARWANKGVSSARKPRAQAGTQGECRARGRRQERGSLPQSGHQCARAPSRPCGPTTMGLLSADMNVDSASQGGGQKSGDQGREPQGAGRVSAMQQAACIHCRKRGSLASLTTPGWYRSAPCHPPGTHSRAPAAAEDSQHVYRPCAAQGG